MSIWVIFKLLGSLALLMFGMKSMSEALQKMAGPYRYAGDSVSSVINSNDGNDGFVRECWSFNTSTGHFSHYGCKYRYDSYGMDYVCRYVV